MQILRQLYRQLTSGEASQVKPLGASGSNRRYFRLTGEQGASLIGVIGTSAAENRAFCYLSEHFAAKGLPVPKVLIHSDDFLCYLQQDLGDQVLFDALAGGRRRGIWSDVEVDLLRRTMRLLPEFQFRGAEGLDFSRCYPQPAFDRRMIGFDQNYFKYCFLKTSGLEFDEIRLDEDFRRMADMLLQDEGARTFMYRDFQARNVMISGGEPWFIDFQGGRRGPVYYDIASFVYQARSGYDHALREMLIDTWLEAARPYAEYDAEAFRSRLRHFVLFRTLQVLGAYGFRGRWERKPHFLQSIPMAIATLRELLGTPFTEYPYLCQVLQQLCELPEYAPQPAAARTADHPALEVLVTSFSFRRGAPQDESGNGGGYVFDCRGMDNPGRYEPYKNLTGLDQEVIDFLEGRGEIQPFLARATELAASHVRNYISRGFTHLMLSFGCTGGQHRSVYSAQHLAEELHRQFPDIRIRLRHRELGIEKVL